MRIVDAWHNRDRTRTPRYGRGMRWVAHWREDPTRPERKRSFRTRDEAQAFLDDLRDAQRAGITTKTVLCDDWVTTWRARQTLRPGTIEQLDSWLKNHIRPPLEGRILASVRRGDIQDIVAAWATKGLAPRTIATMYPYLAQIFRDAVHEKLIRETPCVKISLPEIDATRIRPLSVDQVQAIADTMTAHLRPAVAFAAATGLRPGEWRGLTADRIDLTRHVAIIDRQLIGSHAGALTFGPLKTRYSEREVNIGPATERIIAPLLEAPGSDGLLFTHDGRPLSRQALSGPWTTMKRKVDFDPGRGWHQLRHHHASLLIAGGMSPVAVAHRLGHKDATETLQTYGHLWPTDSAQMVQLSDGLITLDHHQITTVDTDPSNDAG